MGNSQSNLEIFKKELGHQIEKVELYPSPDAETIKTQSKMPTKPASQHQYVQKIDFHAELIKGENEFKVNAFDGRKQILETGDWPNSVHGVLAFKVGNITTWGTGILIGPRIVLTAGHNLYDHETKTKVDVKSLQFLPGMNGQLLPFELVEVEQYFVSPNFIEDKEKEDYGILILKKPIGEVTGYFGLACLEPGELKEKRINITGYPGDKVASKSNTYEMWGMEGIASSVDTNKGQINYLIDTWKGQSGSGVWYKEGEDYYVCGVHVKGTKFVNSATLLTRAMYKQIHAWVQNVGFREFLFRMKDGEKNLGFWHQEITAECLSLLIKYQLENLTSLLLRERKLGDEEAKVLAQNTSWINLSELNLSENFIKADGAKALAKNTSWTNLSELNLGWNSIGAEGAKALAQNTSWTNLSLLSLGLNNIGAEGAKALAKNTSWINLSQLYLFGNNIDAGGAEALSRNTSWTKLSKLNLSSNNIGKEGVKALTQNITWTNLSDLYLDQNNIGVEGAKALAQKTSWTNLSQLSLSGNGIGAEGIKALVQNTSWVQLSFLYLDKNSIGTEGAQLLAQKTSWTSLSDLSLSDNRIGIEGIKALAQNTAWINLSDLNLEKNNMNAEGAKILAQNTSWINLSRLNLKTNNLGDEGAKSLAQNTSWNKLSWLDLDQNQIQIQAEGEMALKQNKTWSKEIVIITYDRSA